MALQMLHRTVDGNFWGWDELYAQQVVKLAIQEARREYEEYLGDGNDLETRAQAMFSEVASSVDSVVKRCVRHLHSGLVFTYSV